MPQAPIIFDFTAAVTTDADQHPHLIAKDKVNAYADKVAKFHEELMAEKAAGKLGFAELPDTQDIAEQCRALAEAKRGDFENFVVLGIGGSALGPIAVHNAVHHPHYNLDEKFRNGYPRFFVEDNIDPDHLQALIDAIDVKKTLFNVISKSGGTAETMSQFLIFRELLKKALGDDFTKNIVVTTSADSGVLREIVDREGYDSLVIPKNVGGRFSELTPVGLFPAAMTGIDVMQLLAGAKAMAKRCDNGELWNNPAYLDAVVHFLADTEYGQGVSVMMPYSSALRDIADWYRQLWAESLGKKFDVNGKEVNVGQTPVKALGVTDQHSQVQLYAEGPFDKIFTFLAVDKHASEVPIPAAFEGIEGAEYLGGHTIKELFEAERKGTAIALSDAGRPSLTITVPKVDAFYVGALLYFFELETAMAGKLYNINAFDQPGVEAGKRAAYALMGRSGYEDERKRLEATKKESDQLVIE